MNERAAPTQRLCPVCRRPVASRAPGGLCPSCLGGQLQPGALLHEDGTGAPTGRQFGDYELLGEIAAGGMGVVYCARQVSLNRTVALKMIRSGRFASAGEVQRFRTEAEAAAHLDHPNIVPIYDVGEQDGQHFFSMRLVEGGNLAEANAKCPARDRAWLRRSAEWIVAISHAVHHAHQRGVLHRDLKPTNILIDEEGEPHLTDFGLAKLVQDGRELTQTMAVLGTPSYMAPEQAAGKARQLTTAADIYSIGAILYELVSGRPPFAGESAIAILQNAASQEPRALRKLNPAVDLDLETICARCLEKDPARRYASAQALAEDLERWLEGRPIEARPSTPWERSLKWVRRNPAVTALGGLVLVGIVAVFAQWLRAERNAAEARRRANENREQLIHLSIANGVDRLDARDNLGALVWFGEAMRLDTGNAERERSHRLRFASVVRECPKLLNILFPGGPVHHAEFNPDGTLLLTSSDSNTVTLWKTDTGERALPALIHSGGSGKCVARFSADGKSILSVNGLSAKLWHTASGTESATLELAGVRQAIPNHDATLVALAAANAVILWDVPQGQRHDFALQTNATVREIALSPDGESLGVAEKQAGMFRSTNWVSVFGVSDRQRRFPPRQVSHDVTSLAFSPDSSRVAAGHSDGSARIWNTADGSKIVTVKKDNTWLERVAFSPDGRMLATSAGGHIARLFDAENGEPISSLSGHKSVVVGASFSHDGTKVLTHSFDGTTRLHDQSGAAFASLTPPILQGGLIVAAQFHPDEERFFTASANGNVKLWSLARSIAQTNLLENGRIVDVNRGGRFLLLHDGRNSLRAWDTKLWTQTGTSISHSNAVSDAGLNHDASRLMTVGYVGDTNHIDYEVIVWDVPRGRLQSRCLVPWSRNDPFWPVPITASENLDRFAVYGLSRIVVYDTGNLTPVFHLKQPGTLARLAPDGSALLVAISNALNVFDVPSGRPRFAPLLLSAPVRDAEFSRDGKRIVSCAWDAALAPREARVWDAMTGAPAAPPVWHNDGIWSVGFSPDGRYFVTAGEDDKARVWDVASGVPLSPPMRHGTAVKDASFSQDGRWVATASADRSARVWDAHTGEAITPKFRMSNEVERALFVSDQRFLLTAARGEVILWQLPVDTRPWAELIDDASVLSGHELDSTGALVPIPPEKLQALWKKRR